jgi:hypothetical protein
VLASIAVWGASTLLRTSGRGAIVISLRGNLATTVDPTNVNILVALERRIAALPGVQTVLGPATFIARSADQTNRAISRDLAAVHASGPAARRQQRDALLVRYGYIGVPSIDNESFVGELIFGSGTQPKPQLASLFPDNAHARVLVRPRAGLSDTRAKALGDQIERLVVAAPFQTVQAFISKRSTSWGT